MRKEYVLQDLELEFVLSARIEEEFGIEIRRKVFLNNTTSRRRQAYATLSDEAAVMLKLKYGHILTIETTEEYEQKLRDLDALKINVLDRLNRIYIKNYLQS